VYTPYCTSLDYYLICTHLVIALHRWVESILEALRVHRTSKEVLLFPFVVSEYSFLFFLGFCRHDLPSAVGPKMLKTGSRPLYRMVELLLDDGISGCMSKNSFLL